MRKCFAAALCACFAMLAGSCGIEKPTVPDGEGVIVVAVADTSGLFPGGIPGEPNLMADTEVNIQSRTHNLTGSTRTNEAGIAAFEGLPAGNYTLYARRELKVGPQSKKVFTGFGDLSIRNDSEVCDTILVTSQFVSNLVINEILFSGSCASTYYFYDQFVELYNASEDTLYLDGIILTRQGSDFGPDMETKDFVRAIYAFQFPGTPVTGREYPILPSDHVVIAADAVNHKQWCSNAVDLSRADWETFNAFGNDYDVPSVPNLDNAIPGNRIDYLISLGQNAAVIATGEEYTINEDNDMLIPIRTIIDGVEWSPNPALSKKMTLRVDAGFAGIGISRYSGYSTERREPGLDSNNSTFDFVNVYPATPGFQHGSPGGLLWR